MKTKLFSLLLLLISIAQSQNTGWTVFSPRTSGPLSALAIDKNDNKWVHQYYPIYDTYLLYQFHGTTWTEIDTITIKLGKINTIFVDKDNNVYVGTGDGLSKFDGINWQKNIMNYPTFSISQDKNSNFWIGTSNGLLKFDGVNWTILNTSNSQLVSNNVSAVGVDSNNTVWVGYLDRSSVSKFDGSSWQHFNLGSYNFPNDRTITSLLVDKQNSVWVGLKSPGDTIIAKINNNNITNFFRSFPTINPSQTKCLAKSQNHLWICTDKGLIDYDDSTFGKKYYTTSNSGLTSNVVTSIAIDQNNIKWIATDDGKLCRLDDTPFVSFNNQIDSLRSGTQYQINWQAGFFDFAKLEYSTNNGATWNDIAPVPTSLGSYIWQVPVVAPPSSQCKLRISNLAGGTPFAETNTFTIYAKVEPPVINLSSGEYNNSQTVIVTCSTTSAQIQYTLDNTLPTLLSAVYSQPLTIDSSQTLRVKAFKSDWVTSDEKSATYTLKVAVPVLSLSSGTYNNVLTVAVSSITNGVDLRYTIDGSAPSLQSPKYLSSLIIDSSQTLRVKGFKTGWTSSDEKSATYTLLVAAPVLSLNSGTYNNVQTVTVSSITNGADLRYTIDVSAPFLQSPKYISSLTIDSSQTLRVKGFKTGWTSSNETNATYTLKVAGLEFNPVPYFYSIPQNITITSLSDSIKMYYTSDNSEPNESSTLYTTAILIDTNKILKAKAFRRGWTPSDTKTGNYQISGQVFTVNFQTPSIWFDTNFDGKEAKTINPVVTISYGSIVRYEWRIGSKVIGNANSVNAELPTGTWCVVLSLTSDRGVTKKDSVKISVYAAEAVTSGSIESAVSQLSENIYFVTSKGGSVYRFDTTGVIAWTIQTGGSIQSTTCVSSQDNIYVGSNDTRLYSFNYQGIPRWDKAMGGTIVSSPSAGLNGLIYVGISTGRLFALDEAGNLKWSVQTGGQIYSSVSIDENGVAYFGSNDGKLYAVSSTGTVLWNYTSTGAIRTSPGIGLDSSIVFGSDDGFLYKVDWNGSLKWKYQTGGQVKSSPIIGLDGVIYFGSGDGKVYSISKTGNKLWEFNAGSEVNVTPALGTDGSIYFGALNGTIYALDQNGNQKWMLQTAKPILAPMLVTSSKIIMVGDTLGKVYIIKIPSNGSLANLDSEFIVSSKTVSVSSYEWWTFKGNNQRTGYRKNITTSVRNPINKLPERFTLHQNYPNPFNPSTIIEYDLTKDSRVKILLFDMLGRIVRTLVDEDKSGGSYKIEFNANDLSSGVYFYHLQTKEFTQTKKLILMR